MKYHFYIPKYLRYKSKPILNKLIQLISLFFFGMAFWLILKDIEKVGFDTIVQMIIQTPYWVILLALFFVLCNYLSLCGYDALSLDYIHIKIPFKTTFKTSALGFAVSNTVGHAYISGGAIRYLLYTPFNVSRAKILLLIAFETLTIFMGMGFIYVIATLLLPFSEELNNTQHLKTFYIVSAIIILTFILYWYIILLPQHNLRIGGVTLKTPDKITTYLQLLIGFTDNFLLSVIFYTFLRYHLEVSFLSVFIVFTLAQITAQASQVPGGLGVLTSLFLLFFPHAQTDKSAILASLFLYRITYFFIPFFLALFYLGFYEIKKYILKKIIIF